MDLKNSVVILSLPFPPSVNTYWRYAQLKNMKYPMHMISKKGRDYTDAVKRIIISQAAIGRFTKDEKLKVIINLQPPDRRRRDIDNYTKGIFDSLSKAGFWGDDSQVRELGIKLSDPIKPGCAYVQIEILSEKENI